MNKLRLLSIRQRVRRKFKKSLGYPLNLDAPRTYCEKIQWLKFNHNGDDSVIIKRADKFAVREFITSRGFGEQLIPLYGFWKKPEDIEWKNLPDRFVLKLNNGSGRRYCWFVNEKSGFAKSRFVRQANRSMAKKYGERQGEFHYAKMPAKIIAEKYLAEDSKSLRDYKFYCFNGEVAFFSVEQGKPEGVHVRDYYEPDWTRSKVKFFKDVARPNQSFERPENFEQMVVLAKDLSRGYPHVRVDLYNVGGKVYFGELTYTPENGFTRWDPPSLDLEYGALMNVYDVSHRNL